MKRFVQFMMLNNERTYIDPQTIVRFSEYKYRDNDIGYVGTKIEYTGNDSTLVTFTVKDPIDAVADILADTPKSTDIPALNERLILNKKPGPVLTENLDNFPETMYEKVVKGNKRNKVETLEEICEDFNWANYRPLEHGEKIYASDKVKLGRKPYSVSTDIVGKFYSSKFDQPVYRQYVFQPGDTVQHIKPHDTPIYKVVDTVKDLAGHLYCVLEGRRGSVPIKDLVLYTPPPVSFWPKDLLKTPPEPAPTPTQIIYTPGEIPVLQPCTDPEVGEDFINHFQEILTYTGPSIEDFIDFLENDPVNLQIRPTPSSYKTLPQETPPCNGNGEAQSTEE